jgi:hypothetical protein
MATPDDSSPKPEAKAQPRTSVSGYFASTERSSDWADGNDLADRQAIENARREQMAERPPHY